RPAGLAEHARERRGIRGAPDLRAERVRVALQLERGTEAIRVGADQEDPPAGAPRLRRELDDGRRLAVAGRAEEEPDARRGRRRRCGPEGGGERRVEPRAALEALGGLAQER